MTREEGGGQPRRNTDQEPEVATEPRTQDPTLAALDTLMDAVEKIAEMTEHVTARADYIRACRLEGHPYREIVRQKEFPLIAGLLTENIRRLEAASTRFRQAEAAALHAEGMTMEEIGQLFGLTRQRISALIRGAAAAPPNQASDPGTALPATAGARDDPGQPSKSVPRANPSP